MRIKLVIKESKTALLFASVLLLCSCDGGIFGTGGPDTMGLDAGLTPDVSMGSPGDLTDGAGVSTAGANDAGETTTGNSDGGSGTTDVGENSNTDSGGTADAGSTVGINNSVRIENTTATLSNGDVLIRVVNASDTTINVFDIVDVRKDILYGDNGIAPGRVSAANPTSQGDYQREIFDNDDLSNILLALSPLVIGESTFTTLVFRSTDSVNSILALPTDTSTSDTTLAKLRVVQTASLGNPDLVATLSVLSGGENPGGIDVAFAGVAYNAPVSVYMELPEGDYLLSDSLARFSNQAFSVVGGEVYTVLLTDDDDARLLAIKDSDVGAQ